MNPPVARLLIPAILLACAGVCACASTSMPTRGDATIYGEQVVPLSTVLDEGRRYVVEADLGLATPVPLMVHGNSRMFLSVTHAVGEQVTGKAVPKVADYGYSSRGKGLIAVPMLRIGGREIPDLRDVPVFDFAEDGDTLIQGMVGVPFLTSERAVVDFSRDILVLGAVKSDPPNRKLLDAGYRQARMKLGADDRMTIQVRFPALGRTIPITPSTVAGALSLHRPLFQDRVSMSKAPSPDRSPSGTSPALYLGDGVEFEIAGSRFRSPASFEDWAEYGRVQESELESYGILGYDWMKQHEAVLDYANLVLYFKP